MNVLRMAEFSLLHLLCINLTQERLYGREAFDLTSPSGTTSLKMRINEVQNMLSKNGAMLGKYMAGPDADDIEVQAELRRIRTNREIRARSEVWR